MPRPLEPVQQSHLYPVKSSFVAMPRRGNPNWGKPIVVPALPTEFDVQVKHLRLTKANYVDSVALKRWCERNRNRVYVPEWLLDAWKLEVGDAFSA